MINEKEIKEYILKENLKQIKAELVEIKKDSVIVKNDKKEIEISVNMPYLHHYTEQLEFTKEAFEKLNNLSHATEDSGEFENCWEDIDEDNIETGENYELICGSKYGQIDFRIETFDYITYDTYLECFEEEELGEIEYEELLEVEIEKMKIEIEKEFNKIDKDEKIFIAIDKERSIEENIIYVGKSYDEEPIRFYYFDDCDKDELEEVEDIDEIVSHQDITLYYTKATREDVKKAKDILENIVDKCIEGVISAFKSGLMVKIQKYLIEKNIKENFKDDKVSIDEDDITIKRKNENKPYFKGYVSNYNYTYSKQVELLKDIFKKRVNATTIEVNDVFGVVSNVFKVEFNEQEKSNYGKYSGCELLHGSHFGYEISEIYIKEIDEDVFKERLEKVKQELHKVDEENNLCVFYRDDKTHYDRTIYKAYDDITIKSKRIFIGEGFGKKDNINVCHFYGNFSSLEKQDDFKQYIRDSKVTFFYTKCTYDEIKKAKKIVTEDELLELIEEEAK